MLSLVTKTLAICGSLLILMADDNVSGSVVVGKSDIVDSDRAPSSPASEHHHNVVPTRGLLTGGASSTTPRVASSPSAR